MSDNPYSSPSAAGAGGDTNVKVLVLPPAILLLLLAIATLALEFPVGYTVVIDTIRFFEAYGAKEGFVRAAPFTLSFALVVVSHLVVLVGMIQMCRFAGYRFAKAAAIMSLIPLLSPGYCLGIPIGIWALLVLRKPAVRDSFRNEQPNISVR